MRSPNPRGGRNHVWSAKAIITRSKKRVVINHPPIRTLADMSEAEIVELERRYQMPVIRPRSVA